MAKNFFRDGRRSTRVRWLIIGLFLASLFAGCTQQMPSRGTTVIEAFEATVVEHFGTSKINVTLDFAGPYPFVAADGVVRAGYKLTERYTRPMHGDGDYDVLDANLQFVRNSHCDYWNDTQCRESYTAWNRTFGGLGRRFAFGLGLTTDAETATRPYYYGNSNVTYVLDDKLLPVSASDADDGTLIWQRISYKSNGLLSGAEIWPRPGPLATLPAHANALFPDADKDLYSLGFTALDALEAMKRLEPQFAVGLATGGCIPVTRMHQHNGTNVVGKVLATVEFVLQTNTDQAAYWVDWQQDVLGHREFVKFATPGPLPSHSKVVRSCDQLAKEKWPATGVQRYLDIMNQWARPHVVGAYATYAELTIGDDGNTEPMSYRPMPGPWEYIFEDSDSRLYHVRFDPSNTGFDSIQAGGAAFYT